MLIRTGRRRPSFALAVALASLAALFIAPAPPARASFQMMGERILALDAGSDRATMDAALDHAVAADVEAVSFSVNWNDIEPTEGVYKDPGRCNPFAPDNQICPGGVYIPGVFETARQELIPRGLKIVLNVRPIMGKCKVTPTYLMDDHWNTTGMTDKFKLLLWAIHDYLLVGTEGTLDVALMTIGTEVEGHLQPGTNTTADSEDHASDYSRYAAFLAEVRPFARTLSRWTDLPIGVATAVDPMLDTSTADGNISESAAIVAMNDAGTSIDADIDRVMFTYYPLGAGFLQQDPWTAIDKIPDVIDLFPGREFDIVEAGYSTSPVIDGSREKQRQFIEIMFAIWDEFATPDPNNPVIHTILFNWQLELGPRVTEYIVNSPWFGGGCAGGLPGTPSSPTGVQAQVVGTAGSTTWKYVVEAVNGKGNSLGSAEVAVSTGNAILSTFNYNRIWWPAVSGATSYVVSRTYVGGGAAPANPSTVGVLGSVTYPEFWDQGWIPTSGLLPRVGTPSVASLGTPGLTTYEYFVVARTASGQSLRSVAATTATGASLLTTTNKNRVSWPAVPGATSYDVYRAFVSPGGSPATTGRIGNVTTTSLDDTGLAVATNVPAEPVPPTITNEGTPGTKTYRYYVVAYNANGDSMPSLENETQTGAATLTAMNRNVLTWPAVSGATGYKVYRSFVDAGTATPSVGLIATTNSSTFTFTDTGVAATAQPVAPGSLSVAPQGLTGSTTYRYHVYAVRSPWNSLNSRQAGTSTGRADLTTSNFNRVSWQAVPGATGYAVYRSYAGPGAVDDTVGYIGTATSTSFDDTGIAASAIPAGTQNFYEYIGTLGLRDFAPVVDKPGFTELDAEAHCRTAVC